MKFMSFTRETVEKLVAGGYTHIEIKQSYKREDNWILSTKNLFVLKALDRIDTLPPSTKYFSIHSKEVEAFFANENFNCFVIVDIDKNIK